MIYGYGLLRQRPLAVRAAYGLTGFQACLIGAVGSMGAVQVIKGDPAASAAVVPIALTVALGIGGVAAWLIRTIVMQDRSRADRAIARRGSPLPNA